MPSLFSRFKVPTALLYSIAYIGKIFGNFRLTPFTVTMMTIDRWFDITNAEVDLKYKPVVERDVAWAQTIQWYKGIADLLHLGVFSKPSVEDHKDWWREKAAKTMKN